MKLRSCDIIFESIPNQLYAKGENHRTVNQLLRAVLERALAFTSNSL